MKLKQLKKQEGMQPQFLMPITEINNLNKDKEYKLLEIGAEGRYLKGFFPNHIRYSSLDYQGKQDYIFDLNKGEIPIEDNSFDIIVCLETLEHIFYPHKVMKEILRIAKPTAIFFISMPNEFNFYLRVLYLFGKKTDCQETFRVVERHQHIQIPRVKDILNFFSEYLNIEKIDYGWSSRSNFNPKFSLGKFNKDLEKNNITKTLFSMTDKLINSLSSIYPSMFSRIVVIKGSLK